MKDETDLLAAHELELDVVARDAVPVGEGQLHLAERPARAEDADAGDHPDARVQQLDQMVVTGTGMGTDTRGGNETDR